MATRSRALGVVILATFGACGGGGGGRGATGGAGGGAVDPNGTQSWTWQECGTIPATPAVESQGTDTVRFVPDGRVLARTRDGRALLLQPAEPSAPPAIFGASGGSPAFSLDGALVAESSGTAIAVRRIANGTLVREVVLPAGGGAPCAAPIALSTSGAHLLARGQEGMCVYDLAAGRVTARLPFSWGAATFRGNTEELVAVTTFNPTVGVTVVRLDASGAELGRAVVPRDAGVWLSPDGSVAASVTAAEDGVQACALWNATDGAELWSASARVDASWTAGEPAFSARGDLAALCGAVVRTADGTRVRDMISRAAVIAVHGELDVWSGRPSLSPDGRHVLGIDDWGGGIALLELDSGRAVRLGGHTSGVNTPFLSISASRDGKVLVSNAGELLVWKIAPHFEDWTATWLTRGRTTFPRIDVSADGRSLAVSGDGRLVYDLATGARLPVGWSTSFPPSDPSGRFCWPELRFSGDGRWLAGVEWDPVLRIRQASGEQRAITELATGCVRVAVSPDSQLLATSQGAVYRLEGGEQLVAGNGAALSSVWSDSVEFSPDQTQFLVSSECSGAPLPTSAGIGLPWQVPPVCRRVELHATSDGRVLRALPASMGPYPSFSPDGSWIVTGGGLYHVPTGTSRSLDGDVRAATFTPDGDIIAGDAESNLIRYCRR